MKTDFNQKKNLPNGWLSLLYSNAYYETSVVNQKNVTTTTKPETKNKKGKKLNEENSGNYLINKQPVTMLKCLSKKNKNLFSLHLIQRVTFDYS